MLNIFQLIVSYVNNIEYHAAVYIPNKGIADYLIQSTMSVVCTKIKEIKGLYVVRQIT